MSELKPNNEAKPNNPMASNRRIITAVLALEIVIVILLVIVMIWLRGIHSKVQTATAILDQVNYKVQNVSGDINREVENMKTEFAEVMAQKETKIATYSLDVPEPKIENNQIRIRFELTPKVYREGLKVTLIATGDREQTVNTLWTGNNFKGTLTADINEEFSRFVVMFQEDGNTSYEQIDVNPMIVSEYVMKTDGEAELSMSQDGEKATLTGRAITIFSPVYKGSQYDRTQDGPYCYPVEGVIITYVNDVEVAKTPVELSADLKVGFYSDSHYYTSIKETFNVKSEDVIRVVSKLTDNFGNNYECEIYNQVAN